MEATRPDFLSKEGLAKVERLLVEDGFRKAVVKLNWLLPFKTSTDADSKRLNDLSGSLDTSLLHDVVIDTVGQLSANQKPDSQTNAATKPAAVAAEKAIKTMYDHVFSREVLQRNAKLGKSIYDLACAGLIEYDWPEHERFKTIKDFIEKRKFGIQKEEEAKVYVNSKVEKTDAEKDLKEVTNVVEEVKQHLTANMESWNLHEKQTDNEVYETNARVKVELEYTEEFAEHQLQYLNFVREDEDKPASDSRLKASRETEFVSSLHQCTLDVFRLMSEQHHERHTEVMEAAEKEQRWLQNMLDIETQSAENTESDLACVKIALQHHNELQDYLRSLRAEEIVKEQEMARLVNAVIRIQRWWRWRMWLMNKRKKKGKGKKGKGKSKGSQSKSKSRSKKKKK